jgi:16S rRNA (guanine1207-N2)-methyltransferase
LSEHYYSSNPKTAHDRQNITIDIRNQQLSLITDAGVFSKAAVDFGSRLLINQMDITNEDRILDMGCGYGVIGLVAARLASRGKVVMVDINERAIALAKENALRNHIFNATIIQSDLYTNIPSQRFTKIITNPPIRAGKQVVHHIYEEAKNWLEQSGQLWIVIQKKQGAASTLKTLEESYRLVDVIAKDKGYYIIRAQGI